MPPIRLSSLFNFLLVVISSISRVTFVKNVPIDVSAHAQ